MVEAETLDEPQVQDDGDKVPNPPPQNGDDKLRALHDAVAKDYDIGSYEEFKQKLSDPDKRKSFFNSVGKDYDLGSYDDFEHKIGMVTPVPEHHIVSRETPNDSDIFNLTPNAYPNSPAPATNASPLSTMQNNVHQSVGNLSKAVQQDGDKVIDAINHAQFLDEFYKSQQPEKSKQDATAVNNSVLPIMLPDEIKAKRGELKQTLPDNPNLQRAVLEGVTGNDRNLKADLYTYDARNRGYNAQTINHNAEQIRNGTINYNPSKQKLETQLSGVGGFLTSVKRGFQGHSNAIDDYNDYVKLNDDQIIAKEEARRKDFDPDVPSEKPNEWGAMVGGNVVPLAKGSAAAIPELIPAAAAWVGNDSYKTEYANTLSNTYHSLRNKGVEPTEALKQAKNDAEFNSKIAFVQGAAATAIGGKSSGELKGVTPAIKSLGKDVLAQTGIAAGGKIAENIHEGKDPFKDVDEDVINNAMFIIGLHSLTKVGREALNPKTFEAVKSWMKSQPPEVVNKGVETMRTMDGLTGEQANEISQSLSEKPQKVEGGNKGTFNTAGDLLMNDINSGKVKTPYADLLKTNPEHLEGVTQELGHQLQLGNESKLREDGYSEETINALKQQYPEHHIVGKAPETNADEQRTNTTDAASKITPQHNEIQTDKNLRTLDYGDFKGQKETPESQKQIEQDILDDNPVGKSGEKFSDFLKRAIPAVNKIIEDPDNNSVLVTHSSVLKAMKVWEKEGRPDVEELTNDPEKMKDFAQKYVDLKPEKEGEVEVVKGTNGTATQLVRHGETEDNKVSDFREDNTELTDKGKVQAVRSGKEINKITGGEIAKVVSSDLPRTIHTSNLIMDEVKGEKPNVVNLKSNQNAVPEQETGSVGVRNEATVRQEVGSNDQSGKPAGEGGQPPTETKSKATGEEENDVTSIRNEIVADKIEKAGLKPVEEQAARDFGTVWEQAKNKIAKGYDVERLIKDLKSKPRALTDVEDAMLLHSQTTKEAQLAEATKDLNEAYDKGDEATIAESKVYRAKLLDELQDIYNVGKSSGRETARGLNARKMMVDRKYSLVNMLAEKRAANGGEPLSEAQEKSVNDKYEAIQKANKELSDKVSELEKRVAELEKGTIAKKGKALADQIRKFKINKGNTAQLNLFGLPAAAYDGAVEAIALSVEGGAKIADAINEAIKKVQFKNDKDKQDFIDHFSALESPKAEANLLDPEVRALETKRQRAISDFEGELKKDEQQRRPFKEKAIDTFVKWQRGFKLSSPITLGKLAMAALTRFTTEPIEEAVGGVISKALPKLAAKSEGQGGFNAKALVKGYKSALLQGMKDSYTIMHGGKGRSDLDVLFGKKGALPPEAIDFFGQLHSATKAPVKRFAFERSLEKRLDNAQRNGVDISDPLVQTRILTESYKDANRAIFMQDNKVSEGWQRMVNHFKNQEGTGSKLLAGAMQWLVPFVKVPANIVSETARTSPGGLLLGAGQTLHAYFGKGIENLKPEEADMIMRNLKKGILGTAALLLGYFNPNSFGGLYNRDVEQKKKEGDLRSGHAKVFGMTIPTWMLESPIFQAMQIGATIRQTKDRLVKGQPQGIGEGVWAGATGLLKEQPLVDEPMRLYEALDPKERNYYFGELAKNLVDPLVLQNIAQWTDPADKRGVLSKMFDPENVRAPKTLKEHVESGLPVLRENVPLKKGKGAGSSYGKKSKSEYNYAQ